MDHDDAIPTCGACGATPRNGQPAKGSFAFMCDDCLARAACSFCNKRRSEVRQLIMGPGVMICDECVELCAQILAEESPPPVMPVAQVRAQNRLRRWWSRTRS